VAVSPVAELGYVLFAIPSACNEGEKYGHPAVRDAMQSRPELVDRVSNFWSDGYDEWTEIVLVAQRSGTLLDERVTRFFDRLDGVLREDVFVPELPSERMEVRGIVEDRLRKLRTSPEMRARYVALLRDVWTAIEPLWESVGRPTAMTMAAGWRERLAERPEIAPLLPRGHWAVREQYQALVDRALRRGEVVLTPLGLAGPGQCFYALPGLTILGCGADAGTQTQVTRADAERAAARFKVLSDPTRLAILRTLHHGCEYTISDIARVYELSQPTVSVHMKMLRDAGLVETIRLDGRTLYRASHDRLRAFVHAAVEEL
jgi:DNA-binding transcriptional ArsR family regulator